MTHDQWAKSEAEEMIARANRPLDDLFTAAIVMFGSVETAPARYTDQTGQQGIPTLPQMIRQYLPTTTDWPNCPDDAVRWAVGMLKNMGAPALASDILGATNARQAVSDMAAAGWFNNAYRNDTGKEPPPWLGVSILHAYDSLGTPL